MPDVNDDATTRRLIDEAARILADEGPAGLSLRRIAAAAQTSTMAVYTRFGDKSGLLAAMHAEGFARLGDELRRAAGSTRPADSLLETGRAYRRAALASPHLYGLMFGPPPAGAVVDDSRREVASATYTPLVEGVQAALAAGWLQGEAERIALHLWVVAHGMVSLELSGMLPTDEADAAQRFDEALMRAADPFLAASAG